MLELSVRQIADTCVVAPEGELDLATANALSEALANAGAASQRVILDLRKLSFCDSSGIGAIVKMQRFFAVEGIAFGVVKGDERVQRAFELAHVAPLVPWTAPPALAH